MIRDPEFPSMRSLLANGLVGCPGQSIRRHAKDGIPHMGDTRKGSNESKCTSIKSEYVGNYLVVSLSVVGLPMAVRTDTNSIGNSVVTAV